MATVLDVIDAFDKRQFTKVEEFLNNIREERSRLDSGGFSSIKETKQSTIDRAFPWLNDIGAGPITHGLGALQSMSDVIAGSSLQSIRIFNVYNMIYTPQDMKSADDKFALIIVLENLGMLDYYNKAKGINPVESEKLQALCIKLIRRIKAGAFKRDSFESSMIIACKSVIRVCLNYKQIY